MIAIILVMLYVIPGWAQKLEISPNTPLPYADELRKMLLRNVFNRSADSDGRSIVDFLKGKISKERPVDDYDRLNISSRMDFKDLQKISSYVELKMMAQERQHVEREQAASRRSGAGAGGPPGAGAGGPPGAGAGGPNADYDATTPQPSRRFLGLELIFGPWDRQPLRFGMDQASKYDKGLTSKMLSMTNQTIYMTRDTLKRTRKFRKLYATNKVYYMGVLYGTLMMLRLKMTSHFNTMVFHYGKNVQSFHWFLIPYTKILATHIDITQTVQRWIVMRDDLDDQLLKEYDEPPP